MSDCETRSSQTWHGTVTIEKKVPLARNTYRIRLACPEIAIRILPGQFVMLRIAGVDDPLLGRPFALYDVVLGDDRRPRGVDIVFLAIGKMTRRLARMELGERLEIWGPLGKGFPPVETEHLVMVAGGIGQTPFFSLAQEVLGTRTYGDPPRCVPKAAEATMCYGARTEDFFAGVEHFERVGVEVQLSTDDGSAGYQGLVTDLIRPVVESSAYACRIVCCGPKPMLAATAEIARELGVSCQVSLETPMACGLGICFSCVTKVRDATGGWDYRRTCVEGPVFDAKEIEI